MTSPDSARSPLTLRLVLAGFGLVVCVAAGLLALRADAAAVGVVLLVLGLVAAVDLVVVVRARRARTAAHAGADHRHDSLFE